MSIDEEAEMWEAIVERDLERRGEEHITGEPYTE
jgi:hypothetical protein